MVITQQPANGKLYFEKSIPDIILSKNSESVITFTLQADGEDILQEEYEYDPDGLITIRDLASICGVYLTPTVSTISNTLAAVDGLTKTFTVKIEEGDVTVTFSFSVLKCGAEIPQNVDCDAWIADHFLSRLPNEKRTGANRNEFLSFLQKTSYGAVELHVEAFHLVDGEVTGVALVLETIAAADRVITSNVSPGRITEALELELADLLYYDIWFSYGDVTGSRFCFLPDLTPYRNRTHFIFENCFGVSETFTATGKLPSKKTAEISLGNISSRYRKTTQDFIIEHTPNSGFLSNDEIDWLDDLLMSYVVTQYNPGTGITNEITVTSIDATDTGLNELKSVSFTYRNAKNQHLQFIGAMMGIFDLSFDETYN